MSLESTISTEANYRKIKNGSFDECYDFLKGKGYETVRPAKNGLILSCKAYSNCWATLINASPENSSISNRKWEVTLYNKEPED